MATQNVDFNFNLLSKSSGLCRDGLTSKNNIAKDLILEEGPTNLLRVENNYLDTFPISPNSTDSINSVIQTPDINNFKCREGLDDIIDLTDLDDKTLFGVESKDFLPIFTKLQEEEADALLDLPVETFLKSIKLKIPQHIQDYLDQFQAELESYTQQGITKLNLMDLPAFKLPYPNNSDLNCRRERRDRKCQSLTIKDSKQTNTDISKSKSNGYLKQSSHQKSQSLYFTNTNNSHNQVTTNLNKIENKSMSKPTKHPSSPNLSSGVLFNSSKKLESAHKLNSNLPKRRVLRPISMSNLNDHNDLNRNIRIESSSNANFIMRRSRPLSLNLDNILENTMLDQFRSVTTNHNFNESSVGLTRTTRSIRLNRATGRPTSLLNLSRKVIEKPSKIPSFSDIKLNLTNTSISLNEALTLQTKASYSKVNRHSSLNLKKDTFVVNGKVFVSKIPKFS